MTCCAVAVWLGLLATCGCGRVHFDPLQADAAGGEITFGNNGDDTFQGTCTDATIEADFPDSNAGNNIYINADAQNDNARGLLAFDVSGLPATATVATAQVDLWVANEVNADSPTCVVGVYAVVESWDEASVTWNERSAGSAWSAPGVDPPASDPTPVGSLQPPLDLDTLHVLPLPLSIVDRWRTAPAPTGLVLICSTSDGVYFISSQGVDGKRPRLRVTFGP